MACARSDFDEFINCEICFEVFDNPQSLICRHVFCLICVNKIKEAAKITCPVCKVQCNTTDIKPDYRTVAMVDSYRKNLTKEPSSGLAKYESQCDECDESTEVSHKCETCDLLLCEKCEASHTVSDGGNHTTKAVSAIAEETRREVNTMLKDLNTKEETLEIKLSNRQKELDDIRLKSENAMKSITEKEEKLIEKIKSHHYNLREEVEKEKAKHVRTSKQGYKNIELCYHELKGNQVILNSLVRDRSDLVIAKTTEQIQKRLQDIEKESSEKQHYETSAENFMVKVIEGNEYDQNSGTKLIFSTNQSMDVRQSEADGAIGSDMCPVEEASDASPSDYTTAEYRDYKVEKTVTVDNEVNFRKKFIYNIQKYNDRLYCMELDRIHVYTKELEPVKTIRTNPGSIRAFKFIKDKYLVTASSRDNGLTILDTDGKDIQRICRGEFYGLAIHNDKLYAYEHNINKVLIFEQTLPYLWSKTGEIYLDYNGNNEHNSKKIVSFLMENEQIYIADDTSICHLDILGKLKRKINQGMDKTEFKSPIICGVDSKGNLLVVEPEISKLTVVGNDGKICVMLLRGTHLTRTHSAFMGHQNEHLWIGHCAWFEKGIPSYLTKYTPTSTTSIIM